MGTLKNVDIMKWDHVTLAISVWFLYNVYDIENSVLERLTTSEAHQTVSKT